MSNPTEAERAAKTAAMGVLAALCNGRPQVEGAVAGSGLMSVTIGGETVHVVNGSLKSQSQIDEVARVERERENARREGIRLKVQSLIERGLKFDSIELSGVAFEVADGIAVAVTA